MLNIFLISNFVCGFFSALDDLWVKCAKKMVLQKDYQIVKDIVRGPKEKLSLARVSCSIALKK